jgi:hypothetical protein
MKEKQIREKMINLIHAPQDILYHLKQEQRPISLFPE